MIVLLVISWVILKTYTFVCLRTPVLQVRRKELVALQWGILLVCHAVKAMAWCAEVALFC